MIMSTMLLTINQNKMKGIRIVFTVQDSGFPVGFMSLDCNYINDHIIIDTEDVMNDGTPLTINMIERGDYSEIYEKALRAFIKDIDYNRPQVVYEDEDLEGFKAIFFKRTYSIHVYKVIEIY